MVKPAEMIEVLPGTKRPASEIVERVVGRVEWADDSQGYCECPGRAQHTSPDGRRDCAVYLDHAPTLYCVHASCREVVEAKNRELRRALADGGDAEVGKPRRLTAEEKLRMAQTRCRERIRLRAASSRERILSEWSWPLARIIGDSPVRLPEDAGGHWRLLLQRFHPDDVVWMGDKFDSGKPEHARHFRTAGEWLESPEAPAPLICPATFRPGSINRSNDDVVSRRFLVVESDTLGKDQVGSVFRWLKDDVKLPLTAIVDTAGKSLHAWFVYPPPDVVDELKLVLPVLGCDPKLFTASQPVRLPGALRDGRHQRLVYLGSEVVE
ncbi:MAG: hypothetical protein WCS99_05035 [Limisphaerales bacterium]